MRKLTLNKNYLLLSILILTELHVLFRGYKTIRVDWYLLIDYTRRIDYAVMYLNKHLIYIILSYCVLFNRNIQKDTKVFIFMWVIADFLHYITLSHLGFEWVKLTLVVLVFATYKKLKK